MECVQEQLDRKTTTTGNDNFLRNIFIRPGSINVCLSGIQNWKQHKRPDQYLISRKLWDAFHFENREDFTSKHGLQLTWRILNMYANRYNKKKSKMLVGIVRFFALCPWKVYLYCASAQLIKDIRDSWTRRENNDRFVKGWIFSYSSLQILLRYTKAVFGNQGDPFETNMHGSMLYICLLSPHECPKDTVGRWVKRAGGRGCSWEGLDPYKSSNLRCMTERI